MIVAPNASYAVRAARRQRPVLSHISVKGSSRADGAG
jgi:hypothetical protein